MEITDGVDDSALVERVQTWLFMVEQGLGRRPMIYTCPGFWNEHMTDQFCQYALWVADYAAHQPPHLNGWNSWNFWQYSQKGTLAGVQGEVDLDRFNGSYEDLLVFLRVPESLGTPAQPSPIAAQTTPTYTVQAGDTLDRIAAQQGVTVAALAEANQITNPDLISVGQVLKLPV